VGGHRILFSGDLGRPDDLLMNPPETPPQADTVLIESTYGDRQHPQEDLLAELGPALQRLAAARRRGRGAGVCRGAGAGRAARHRAAQVQQGAIARSLPVFLDSPMAVHTTNLFSHHPDDHRLSAREVQALAHAATMVQTTDAIQGPGQRRHGPMVILSASGMATGGRVLHHLALYAGDHRNMIILTGYQAPGTRGARIAAAKDHPHPRQDVDVRAEVVQLQSASAHADANQTAGLAAQAWGMRPTRCMWCTARWALRHAAPAHRARAEMARHVPEHGATWPA
jgi:metallo-beta-lactamase family protein